MPRYATNGLKPDQHVITLRSRDITYAALRAKGYKATEAMWTHKRLTEFLRLEAAGRARLIKQLDDVFSFEDIMGDTYDVDVNADIPGGARRLKAEEKRERQRANDEGVWGIIAQVLDGDTWTDLDSCWGFVGDDVEEPYPCDEYAGQCIAFCKAEDERAHFLGFEDRAEVTVGV